MHFIIIGAGLAGLYTAKLLTEKNHKVTVIEARDRVGGRTFTKNKIDLGGQWVSSQQKRVMKLLSELGIEYFPQFDEGNHIMNFGKTEIYDGNISASQKNFIEELNKLSNYYESYQTLKTKACDFLKMNCTDEKTKRMIEWLFKVCICVESDELPFVFWLYFLKSCGGYEKISDIRNGAQEYRIKGGSMSISEKLSKNLNVHLNEPVRIIFQNASGCIVKTDKNSYKCDKVIVTIPLSFNEKIVYSPPLPPSKTDFIQNTKMGSVIKIVVIYKEPFWRMGGYSGEIISDQPPIFLSYDCSTNDYYGLVTFVCAKDIPHYSKQKILEGFAKYFNDKRALTPLEYHEKNWAEDEYSGGCYFATFDVSRRGELQKSFGNIHWAGTETANEWMGYMEGALESGERVVNEIFLSKSKL